MKKIILLFIISSQFVLAQAPNWNWVKKSTGDINEGFACVTTDSNGNVFAGGSIISDTADFGLGTVTTNGYADYSLIKYDASGTPLWMKTGGGIGNEIVYNMTTDSSGNLYATVSFQSASVTFGSYTINNTSTVPNEVGLLDYDIALVKYDTNGTVLWAKKIGGLGNESLATVVCDALQNVYITTFSASQTLMVGNVSATANSNSLVGGVLAKIDPLGTTLWIKRFGNNDVYDNSFVSAPVFDATGNIYVTGFFESETFTLGSITYTNSEPGLLDCYIAKLDSNGNIIWQKALQGNGDEGASVLVVQNELFMSFSTRASQVIGSSTYSFDGINYNSPTLYSSGFIKMNTSGQVNSVTNYSTIFNPILSFNIKTDGASIYFTGQFNTPTISFGATTLVNANSSTTVPTQDIFVAKMNTNGQFLWAKSFGGIGSEDALGFAIDPIDNLFIGGYFDSSLITLGSTTIANTSQTGYVDAYVAKLNSTTLSTSTFEREALVISPNPTQDYVTISTNESIKKISIYDTNGRLLDTQYDVTVNLSGFTTGIYFLDIHTENGMITKKIIKE